MINKFTKYAKELARNPLGIIALFISLIYGFASFVLGIAADKLCENERTPLIWFLIIFPIIVLAAFVYLVVNHHGKLYSPLDFRDDKNFLETINEKHKLLKEYNEAQNVEVENNFTKIEKADIKPREIKRSEKREILSFNDFKDKYIRIENLVFNEIEKIYCAEARRNVKIKGLPRSDFDGVIIQKDEVIFIEIKYVRSMTMSKLIANSLISIAENLDDFAKSGYIERKVTLLIFFVYEVKQLDFLFSQIENLEKELKQENLNIVILKKHKLSLQKNN